MALIAPLDLCLISRGSSVEALGLGGRERAEDSTRGTRLVDECLRFAKRAGYARITLWTNDVLIAARRIYERAGFVRDRREPHHSFGHDLVGEFWSRDL